jgi:DNA polymerase III delta subunit
MPKTKQLWLPNDVRRPQATNQQKTLLALLNPLLLPKLKLERRRKLLKPPSQTHHLTIKANKASRRNSHVNSLKKKKGKEILSSVKAPHHLTCRQQVLHALLALVVKEE